MTSQHRGAEARSGSGWLEDVYMHTIWGRSKESFPIVLKTKSCSLLTVASRSSPRAAIVNVAVGIFGLYRVTKGRAGEPVALELSGVSGRAFEIGNTREGPAAR
jgi:hypothetical protein